MYLMKENALDDKFKIKQNVMAEEIGIAQPTLSKILNRKLHCSKVLALCITKYLDSFSEIEDFFEKES